MEERLRECLDLNQIKIERIYLPLVDELKVFEMILQVEEGAIATLRPKRLG